ncbi:hypothetical protein CEUSTIGMA_g11836.t1 [Chlamydomonas eustigma]|uniref:Protein kinase domain-containing protein n=1 Tax=Chlamydomonas eustigma TaxID=1157962 RepID=A0A250XMT6_9CHLO|nr:hypothetical protein CEUSTIGMA_g11836.t1 [Chlamydomonas eustigma]|eukprot:GAX84415.1 hypothetical protein CEUSTIGMA_g11836.t1 [Chlamydomonas eustigma]
MGSATSSNSSTWAQSNSLRRTQDNASLRSAASAPPVVQVAPRNADNAPSGHRMPVVTASSRNAVSSTMQGPSGRNPASESDDGVRACCKFRLVDLSEATSGFSAANVIGEGGFGKVYRGTLLDGTDVAVKRLDPLSLQGDREFYAEVGMLTRLRHPNLVCIMGMCNENGQKLGVFEYMPRGSLRELLDKKILSWRDRMTVAVGSARGLAFLHEISQPSVIHCDFKSTNVLIDAYGQAHVADFGLARHIGGYRPPVKGLGSMPFASPDITTVTSIRGTYGYLSPEYLEKGHASVRADVFAFGVVMLELMTGLQPVDTSRGKGWEVLADWLRPKLRQPDEMFKLLDPSVSEQASAVQVAVMCEIAEACLRANPRERPSMLEVIKTLSAVSRLNEASTLSLSVHDSMTDQASASLIPSPVGQVTAQPRKLTIPPARSSAGTKQSSNSAGSFTAQPNNGIRGHHDATPHGSLVTDWSSQEPASGGLTKSKPPLAPLIGIVSGAEVQVSSNGISRPHTGLAIDKALPLDLDKPTGFGVDKAPSTAFAELHQRSTGNQDQKPSRSASRSASPGVTDGGGRLLTPSYQQPRGLPQVNIFGMPGL